MSTDYPHNNADSKNEPTGSDVLLNVDEVVKNFGGLTALDRVSFEVPEGSITGLIGPNGAGKSTLFNCITGVHALDSGAVRLRNESIHGLSPNQVADRGVGRTFQTPQVFRGMTVRENLAFAANNQTGETVFGTIFRPKTVQREEKAIQERVDDTLEFLELDHLGSDFASALSGGQRKLLELGRILMMDPAILMLDEPVAGVNPALTDELLKKLHTLNERGRTILFIEHDMEVVMNHSDRVIVLQDGRTLATGPPEIVQEDDRVIDAYLGGYE